MFEGYLTRNVKEGEDLVAIVRPYWLTMVLPLGLSVLLLLLDVFFFAWFLQFGSWGFSAFSFLFLFSILWVVRTWIVWSLNAFVITTERIIDVDQKGFFHRTVSEAALVNIQDVSFAISGPWQTLFQYGTVIIQTAGAKNNLELEGVRHPEQVQERITKVQQGVQAPAKTGDVTAAELLALAKKIKDGVVGEKLQGLMDSDRQSEQKNRGDALTQFFGSQDADPPERDLRRRKKRL